MKKRLKIKKYLKNSLLDILFPKFCLGCNKEGTYLCTDCVSILGVLEHHYCLCDKNPIRLIQPGKCSRCKTKNLSGLFTALPYQERSLTKKLISSFKYPPYLKELADPLSDLIIKHFLICEEDPKEILKKGHLIPIPLTEQKLKKRNYNQAQELTKQLSEKLKVSAILNNLIKTKKTKPQVGLSKKERKQNLKNAFSCTKPSQIKRKEIFLIDDVYTTGATMEEAAKTLKKAGAKKVWGIAIARG